MPPGQRGDPRRLVVADEVSAADTPALDEFGQRFDLLGLAGGQGRPLPKRDDLPRRRLPTMGGHECLDQVILGLLDHTRTLRELLPQLLADAVDLPLRLG